MLSYLEYKLRVQYEVANTTGVVNNYIIDTLKSRIDDIRDNMAKGVKIRSRVQDAIYSENISTYLIAEQKDVACRKIITSITTEYNIQLNNFKDILG